MSIKKLSLMMLSALSVAVLLNGCGSSKKESATSGGVKPVSEAACRVCHSTSLDPVSKTPIVADYLGSAHNTAEDGCQGCHGGGAEHNGIGPIPFPNPLTSNRCSVAECHGARVPTFAAADYVTKCSPCHSGNGIHGAQPAGDDCVGCHSVARAQHTAGMVNDNDGVRAITTEFGKWSHHVTGVDLNNAHCAACHLEAKVVSGGIEIDRNYHMADAKTHLRNSDTDVDMQWDPETPNHTTMDNFCMSCHDADGATSPISVSIQAVINAIPLGSGRAATASALNPFGDTISNQYDQLSRGAVVAVKEQFDQGNKSHHAVRAARYQSNNLNQTQINAIIAANVANGETGTAIIAGGTGTMPATATELATVGTLYETGKFATLYKPFSTPAATVQDTTQLHCADCHTVGQWKAGSSVNADGTATTVAIGAHGSQNEYMLRNSDGTDSTTTAQTKMVCFLCHDANGYGDGTAANTHGAAMSHVTGQDCNGGGNNNAGLLGIARLERTWTAGAKPAVNPENGNLGSGGAGNIFGIKCANCHNASDSMNFGGIHGNAFRVGTSTTVTMNASYKSYSGANGATGATPQALSLVDRKPYRFLPGLGNFRFNGGKDSDAWTRKSIGATGKSERMGCYTLNGASSKRVAGANPGGTGGYGVDYIPNPSPTKAVISGANVSSQAIATDNGILGSWGACTDHAGSSAGMAGHSVTRTSIRPTTY